MTTVLFFLYFTPLQQQLLKPKFNEMKVKITAAKTMTGPTDEQQARAVLRGVVQATITESKAACRLAALQICAFCLLFTR